MAAGRLKGGRAAGTCALLVSITAAACLIPVTSVEARTDGHRRAIRCDERAGTGWVENRLVRIYSHRGRVYACRRPSGASRLLFRTKSPASRQVELAGSFVAWRQETETAVQRLIVLNVRTGKARRIGSLQTGGHMLGPGIASFIVRRDGAIVWLADVGSQEGPYASYTSTLYENSGQATSVLDTRSNPTTVFPISSFGLSSDGRVVYWTDDGQVRSARVS